jgi:putative iron-regulated protein
MRTSNQRLRPGRGINRLLAAAVSLGLLSTACGSNSGGSSDDSLPQQTPEAVDTYAEIVHANYADTLEKAKQMESAIATFIEDPNEETLAVARQSWIDSREPYLQTEAYRFYGGPIDETEGMINAWPLDEAYIDYVEDDASAGIINDPDVAIDEETLMKLNEQGGEENIATGYHAIEFLLWGQDKSEDGPGDRPYADFLQDGDAGNYERRALYLETVCDLLVKHLETVVEEWKPGKDNYRAEFEAAGPEEALRRILTGMIVLSGFETGGERLKAALDSGSQEDEHSCFSDNTHRDMIQDVQGILNVWQGSYERADGRQVEGTSLRSIVRAVDADIAAEIDDRISESLALANDLRTPFDLEIATDNDKGNERVRLLIEALREQEHSLEHAFESLGLEAPVVE